MTSSEGSGAGHSKGPSAADYPVLASKITVPVVPDWAVMRLRIRRLIDAGARGPLTTVTGPPGAGKTMAVASWAASTDRCPVVWVSLDSYDNRPKVFWSYLAAAMRRAGVPVPGVLPGPYRGGVDHVFLLRLVSVLAARERPITLVLDDMHLLTEPTTLDELAYVMRNAGPKLHLVVASRMDPLLPLHRYRLTGDLAEIRADDLAFTVSEAGVLLAHHGVTLSPAALECLTGRTEGWAAGMRLAALSLDGHPDPEQFVKELDAEDSAITGYLVDEVLDKQPRAVRDLLLRTSILESVNPELACELADDQRAADALPALAQSNAFVRPLGNGWYRYHSLFAGVLRLKLRREHRGDLSGLHRRAACWYRRNGRLAEAVRHAADCGDWSLAAGIVVDELAIGELIEPRSTPPLAETFRRMPHDGAATPPSRLLVMAAMELSHGSPDHPGSSLRAAEAVLERSPADEVPGLLAAALIRLELSRRTGDLDGAVAAARRAEALLERLDEDLHARHAVVRAHLLSRRGALELWADRLDEATATFRAGIAAATAPDAAHERGECLGHLALTQALREQLSHAAVLAGEAIEATDSAGLAEPPAPAASVTLASVFVERGELQQAHGQLKQADATLRARPDRLISAIACLIAAQCRLAEGHAAAASQLIRRGRAGWAAPGWLEAKLTVLESRACAAAGDVRSAISAAGRLDPQGPDAAAALAHAWLAAGDHQAARRALETAAGAGEVAPRLGLTGWLLDAQLSYGTGDSTRGRRSLERALQLAKPEQLRLPFALEQTWIRHVLRRDPDLARTYRDLAEPGAAATMAGGRPDPPGQPPPVVEQLSGREVEVLRHLSAMLSTTEIAAEMYISVNTVKTHLRSIYRKLSAAHRSEAVRRARQLGLI